MTIGRLLNRIRTKVKVLKSNVPRNKDRVGFYTDTFNLSTLCVKVSHIHFQLLWK